MSYSVAKQQNIGSVSTGKALAVVVVRVRIRASPLHMDIGVSAQFEPIRHEIILNRRVDLYDIPPLAPHVQVSNGRVFGDRLGSLTDGERERPVLENAAKLLRVHGQVQLQAKAFEQRHGWVSFEDKAALVGLLGCQALADIVVTCGNVVSDPENAVFADRFRDGPEEGGRIGVTERVAQMVVAGVLGLEADGGR